MNKISAIVITYNEEENIEECLKSLQWVSEIIIVDSESIDKTVEIAKRYTDKILTKPWMGFAKQKMFALQHTSNNWVLSVDADERISEELKNTILKIDFEQNDGFKIKRQNYLFGKHITTCGLQNDFQLRLFNKTKTTITDRLVHEGFEVSGAIGEIESPLLHYTYSSIEQAFGKINTYSTLQAQEIYTHKNISIMGITLHTMSAFFRFYFSQKGYKDGIEGFVISSINAITTFLKYIKVWELNKKS